MERAAQAVIKEFCPVATQTDEQYETELQELKRQQADADKDFETSLELVNDAEKIVSDRQSRVIAAKTALSKAEEVLKDRLKKYGDARRELSSADTKLERHKARKMG